MKRATIGLHILQLTSGRLVVQLLGILTVPILTRLYLPNHFGVTQILDSLFTIILVAVCWKFEMAIPLAKDDQETAEIVALSAVATLITTISVAVAVALFEDRIASWYRMPELRGILWFLPLFTLLGGGKHLLTFFAAKEEHFRSIASSEVIYSLTDRAGSLGWGFLVSPSAFGLLSARFFAHVFRLMTLIRSDGVRLLRLLRSTAFSYPSLRATISRHKKFPLFQIWTVFLNTISTQLPPLILGGYFASDVVGYYALSARIVALPMTLLQDAVTTVAFPMMAKEYKETGSLTNITRQMFLRLLQVASFPTVVFGLFGVEIFRLFFGEQWVEAGEYARLIALWQGLGFINLPMRVFVILDRQELGLLMNILMLLLRVIGISLGIFSDSPRLALQAFVVFSVVGLLINIFWQLRLARVSLVWAAMMFCQYAAISLLPTVPIKWLLGETNTLHWLLIGLSGSALGYAGITAWVDASFRQYLRQAVARFGKKNTSCKF